jgi:uncharacterized protein YfcZ (UPF0381/DUF406 family)
MLFYAKSFISVDRDQIPAKIPLVFTRGFVMSVELEGNQVCEACGCAGEIGFVIREGDEVADVTIFADSKAALESELAAYIELAKSVCANVEYNVTDITEESKEVSARFQFEVSAEKLIFELKTRTLAR